MVEVLEVGGLFEAYANDQYVGTFYSELEARNVAESYIAYLAW